MYTMSAPRITLVCKYLTLHHLAPPITDFSLYIQGDDRHENFSELNVASSVHCSANYETFDGLVCPLKYTRSK